MGQRGNVFILEDGTTREDVVGPITESEFTVKEETEAFSRVYHGLPTSVVVIVLEKKRL